MDDERFDWVTARFECSAVATFIHLKSEVESDVTKRNDLFPNAPKVQFVSSEEDGREFTVVLSEQNLRSIKFKLSGDKISVTGTGQGTSTLTATITLNDDGNCRLRVAGKEVTRWQFRKRALESLFFTV